jgi:hypothetical protein
VKHGVSVEPAAPGLKCFARTIAPSCALHRRPAGPRSYLLGFLDGDGHGATEAASCVSIAGPGPTGLEETLADFVVCGAPQTEGAEWYCVSEIVGAFLWSLARVDCLQSVISGLID